MKATIVDLRYRMKEILTALDRNEDVTILYHGKQKGVITSALRPTSQRVAMHPLFGMRRDAGDVEREMEVLRGGRYRAL